MSTPILMQWNGEAFVPTTRAAARQCDELFLVGQRYAMQEVHARSHASHAHYFASLNQIWQSLPDFEMDRFPNVEKLRKTALIQTGFRTETQYACASETDAKRLEKDIRSYDDYQIVVRRGDVVTVYRAKSQDHKSMDKAEFQDSKDRVLDWCCRLIGTTPADLAKMENAA